MFSVCLFFFLLCVFSFPLICPPRFLQSFFEAVTIAVRYVTRPCFKSLVLLFVPEGCTCVVKDEKVIDFANVSKEIGSEKKFTLSEVSAAEALCRYKLLIITKSADGKCVIRAILFSYGKASGASGYYETIKLYGGSNTMRLTGEGWKVE